jgi:hypothetical protein
LVGDSGCLLNEQNFLLQGISAFLEPVAVFDGSEEDATLAFAATFTTTSASFRPTSSGHADAWGGASGSDQTNELRVSIADGIATFLFGHDVV